MTNIVYIRLGRRLAELRRHRLLQQYELAERIGVEWRTVSQLERGRMLPRRTNLQRLAALYGMTPDQLLPDGLLDAVMDMHERTRVKQIDGHRRTG